MKNSSQIPKKKTQKKSKTNNKINNKINENKTKRKKRKQKGGDQYDSYEDTSAFDFLKPSGTLSFGDGDRASMPEFPSGVCTIL